MQPADRTVPGPPFVANTQPPRRPQTQLRHVHEVPPPYQSFFPYKTFNAVQSEVFDLMLHSDRNAVVSAPTGSGKTVALELALIRALSQSDGNRAKIVYIAPTKALCNERTRDWSSRLRPHNITVAEMTGDSIGPGQMSDLQRAQVIVATPEKWDATTRRWKDHRLLMSLIRLFMVDEIHMLNEAKRGATLEAIVSRMRTVISSSHVRLRFIAISATVPNVVDIAQWLRDEPSGNPAAVCQFGEEYRPVPIRKEVFGISTSGNNPWFFDKALDGMLMGYIEQFSDEKPTLIFCPTRKSTTSAADALAKASIHARITDRVLKPLVLLGIGFHHGGLGFDDRRTLEQTFLQGHLLVICTTSTLAVGVNLPAHLVIIKSTVQYLNGRQSEYSDLDVLQMIGRAGRPQFDVDGVAIILTTLERESFYQQIVSGQEVIESGLHEHLIEHLNAEVVLDSVHTPAEAMRWLQSTFLWVRIQKNPAYYRLRHVTQHEAGLHAEERLAAMCQRNLHLLEEGQLVQRSPYDNTQLLSTEYGQLTAKFYLSYKTGVALSQVPPEKSHTLADIISLIVSCDEFEDTRFHQDKGILNALNKHPTIRFRIKGKIQQVTDKINLIIQATLGGTPLTEFKAATAATTLEINRIMQQAARLASAAVSFALLTGRVDYILSTLHLHQSITARAWYDMPGIVRQVDQIGPALANQLAANDIISLARLRAMHPQEIEFAANRNPPFGHRVLTALAGLPDWVMNIQQL
ncbi:hypothetical protein CXG81DRAFT_11104, partial [Caulochytrium protostelioides]